jgi:hypothetical protein
MRIGVRLPALRLGMLVVAASLFGACALARAVPASATAELGVELPTIGATWRHHGWAQTRAKYFSPLVMEDIRDNLGADYVRTGWVPRSVAHEHPAWRREDQALDAACAAGLRVMIIVPGIADDANGIDDLAASATAFFARYTVREFGCLQYAEIANEADLSENGFRSVDAYAAFYERIAPIVASYGIPVITTGVSGRDVIWTTRLAALFAAASPAPPVAGYGFHPYGIPAAALPHAFADMQRAASNPNVYVTELGEADPDELHDAIVNLAPVTPAITIYEYRAQPGEDDKYGLKDRPALFDAVRRAWASVKKRP